MQTGFERVRSCVSVDIDDAADLDRACAAAEAAMRTVEEVYREPPPQALLQEIGTGTVRMDLRFWSGARQMETKQAQHEVILTVIPALCEAGVEMGSDMLIMEAGPRLSRWVAGAIDTP